QVAIGRAALEALDGRPLAAPARLDGPQRAPVGQVQPELLARLARGPVARVLTALDPAARELPRAAVAVGVAHEQHRVALAHYALHRARVRPQQPPVQ